MTSQLSARSGAPAVERNHWFEYKYISAHDLVAEQEYLISRHRAHNRLLHGCGVVCGLEVTRHPRPSCATDWVVVGAGIAIDALGRELILAHDTAHQLPVALGDGGSFVVCVRYREERVQPVPILYADPDAGPPHTEANRIREGVEIVAVPAADFNAGGWDVGGPGCIDPAPATPEGMVALAVADVDPGGEPVTISHANRARRLCPQPARIIGLSWKHGGSISIQTLLKDRRLTVTFDRPLATAEGGARGVGPETFSMTYERPDEPARPVPRDKAPTLAHGGRTAVFEIAEVALRRDHEAHVGKSLVRVTLRCDFILDRDGVPVSGRHLGGHLPTGDGSAGGTFESWFHVTNAAARRAERGKDKEET